MVVILYEMSYTCITRCRESEVAWLINQEDGKGARRCQEPIASLSAYNSIRSFPNSTNKNIVGCWRAHFDVSHQLYLHAFFKFLPIGLFKAPPPNMWVQLQFRTFVSGFSHSFLAPLTTFTTREIVTTATEIQQKTVEGFCGFGRVVGAIL